MAKDQLSKVTSQVADTAKGLAKKKITWGVVGIGLVLLVIFGVIGYFIYKNKFGSNNSDYNKDSVELNSESQANLPPNTGGNTSDETSINNGANASAEKVNTNGASS